MESLTVPANLDSLATISVFITDATSRAGLDDHAAWQVQLAVDEASTNIIQHGYSDTSPGEIELTWRVDGPLSLVRGLPKWGGFYSTFAKVLPVRNP